MGIECNIMAAILPAVRLRSIPLKILSVASFSEQMAEKQAGDNDRQRKESHKMSRDNDQKRCVYK